MSDSIIAAVRADRVRRALAFTRAARTYWLDIHPSVREELSFWRGRAFGIPDPVLRRDALLTQSEKAGHSEGAAAFAILVPREDRPAFVRLFVAFELLADYLDTVSEAKADDVVGNNLQLHRAMAVALGVEPERDDFYDLHPRDDDGGYIGTHISICRELAMALPSYETVKASLRDLVLGYAEAQTLHHSRGSLTDAMQTEQTSVEIGRHPQLEWREVVVGGSSTLAMLALLAAANDPGLTAAEVERTTSIYYPTASSLHIMLDSLVDLTKDRSSGAINQIDTYDSWEEARERLSFLAAETRRLAAQDGLDDLHAVVLAGMAGYYLAQLDSPNPDSATMSNEILLELGPMTKLAKVVHRVHRSREREAV